MTYTNRRGSSGEEKAAGMIRRITELFLCFCLFGMSVSRLAAVPYLYEGFNYGSGNLGDNPPWTNSTPLIAVTNNGLAYPYLMDFSPPANAVLVSTGATVVTYRSLATPATNGLVYFSFLLNFQTQPGNYFFVGLTQSTNASPAKASDPLDLIDESLGSGFSLGIRALAGSTSYLTNGLLTNGAAPKQLDLGTNYLVVMKYNFTNGACSLYLNPPAGNTEPVTPDAMSFAANDESVPDLSYAYIRVGSSTAGSYLISALRVASTWAEVSPSTNAVGNFNQASMLASFLTSLRVDEYWLEGYSVNWLTGAAGGSGPNMTKGTDSHCSAFAGAVADLAGIYILRQPEASDLNLANNQAVWLATNNAGWLPVDSMVEAQHLANTGALVVASYKASSGSGHIAILRPSNRTDASVNTFGPEECQSGDLNFADTNILTGFNQHPGAFPDYILYYWHSANYPLSPVVPSLESGSFTNQQFSSTITSVAGRRYQIQYSMDLANWFNLAAYTNSNTSTNFFTTSLFLDTSPATTQRFYRIFAP